MQLGNPSADARMRGAVRSGINRDLTKMPSALQTHTVQDTLNWWIKTSLEVTIINYLVGKSIDSRAFNDCFMQWMSESLLRFWSLRRQP